MFKKKKILIGLVSCLAAFSLCVNTVMAQDSKTGWDYLQSDSDVGNEYVQELPRGTKDVTKRIYKTGDLEKGVLSMKASFNEFPAEEKISISLRNSDIKEVLRELARLGKKSIIIDNSVGGTISCELEDVSINQAMDMALATAELESRMIGDTIFVASKPAMLRKGLNRRFVKSFKLNYANAVNVATILEASIFNQGLDISTSISEQTESSPSFQATEVEKHNAFQALEDSGTTIDTGDTIVDPIAPQGPMGAATSASASGTVSSSSARTVRIDRELVDQASGYNDAKKLAGEIKIYGTRVASGTHSVSNNSGGPIVIPDTRTNTILVAGVQEDIHLAEQTIKSLDIPKRQVALEVSLIEMSRRDASDMGLTIGSDAKGFSIGYNTVNGFPGGPVVTPNGYAPLTTRGTWDQIGNTFNPTDVARQVGLATVAGGTIVQLSTIKSLTSDIVGRIRALLTKNKLKLIANPNVIVVDGNESLIKLTNQIVNRVTVTQTQTTTTSSQTLADVGIVLNVLPKVSDDGYISMRVRPSVTTPGDTRTFDFGTSQFEITLIQTREAIIQEVRVKSGETVALAGLIREQSFTQESKVPILGDLPVIGGLFHQRASNKEKTELVILITPKIIEDVSISTRPMNIKSSQVPID